MAEVDMYSLDIMLDFTTKQQKQIDKLFSKAEPEGINIDEQYPVMHVLYRIPRARNEAYKIAEKLGIRCAINIQTAWVDEKYLRKTN